MQITYVTETEISNTEIGEVSIPRHDCGNTVGTAYVTVYRIETETPAGYGEVYVDVEDVEHHEVVCDGPTAGCGEVLTPEWESPESYTAEDYAFDMADQRYAEMKNGDWD